MGDFKQRLGANIGQTASEVVGEGSFIACSDLIDRAVLLNVSNREV